MKKKPIKENVNIPFALIVSPRYATGKKNINTNINRNILIELTFK